MSTFAAVPDAGGVIATFICMRYADMPGHNVVFSSRDVSLPYVKWNVTCTAAQSGFGLVTAATKSYRPFPRSSTVASSVINFFGASAFWSCVDTSGCAISLMPWTVRTAENEYDVTVIANATRSNTSTTRIDMAHHVLSWSRWIAIQ